MRKYLAIAGLLGALAIAACASTTPPAPGQLGLATADTVIASTPAGQNVASWISGLNTKLAALPATVNAGLTAAQPLLQNALALGSSLDAACRMVCAAFGATSDDMANEAKAVAVLNDLAANPPTNVATAATNAIAAALTIKGVVAKVAPATANATVAPAS